MNQKNNRLDGCIKVKDGLNQVYQPMFSTEEVGVPPYSLSNLTCVERQII